MGWKKSGSNWWYQNNDGSYPRSRWALIGGVWYYFNASGYMVTGWLKYGGKWYYLWSSGAMATGWITVKNVKYHLASSGAMDTGWFDDDDGKRYYLDSSGAMVHGERRQIGGKWYRFTKDGPLEKNLSAINVESPKNLKLTRKEATFEAKWSLPNGAKNNSGTVDGAADSAYEDMTTTWSVTCEPSEVIKRTAPQTLEETTNTMDLDAFDATNPSEEYTRESFYPCTSRKVVSVDITLTANGKFSKPSSVSSTHALDLPSKPDVKWTYTASSGLLTAEVSSPSKSATGERYDTMYTVKVKLGDGTEETLTSWESMQEESVSIDYDTSEYTSMLAEGQVVEFTVLAYNRGLRGDNPSSSNPVSSSRTLAYPNAAVIKSITTTSKDTTGRISVAIEVGANTASVKLQRRHGETGGWQDVSGATDNGNAKMLYDTVGLAEPVDGEYLYYHIVSTKDNLTTISEPFRADELYTPRTTTASTSVGIISLEMDTDGEGAKMVVGWTETKVGYATEVSWSTDHNAWESNKRPDLYEIVWEDAEPQSLDWEHTANFYVRGLTAGVTYYFKARRAYEDGNYSDYASRTNIATYSETSTVSLSAPTSIVRGDPISLFWSYSGTATQVEYHVHPDGNPNISLASGRDSMSSASILPERYGDAETLSMYVSVGVGGEVTSSNVVTVSIIDAPMCEIECDAVCAAKPLYVEAYTDLPYARLGYKVISEGIVQQLPDMELRQLRGDIIATGMVTPTWEEVSWSQTRRYGRLSEELQNATDSDEIAAITAELAELSGTVYMTEVAVSDLHLVDTADYVVEAFTDDPSSGLSSKTATAMFEVEWTHQADVPSEDITVVPDVDGRLAVITLDPPDGATEGDVYDLYRGTAEGFDLIRAGLPLDAVVTDRFAAFGQQMYYRVCTRTVDGDIEFASYPYNLPVKSMRFDWADGSGETIHNVKLSDSYSKSFEARTHMDGTIGGFWGPSVSRTGSYSATCIEGVDDGPIIELARHGGSAFCRTPDGDAYRCNVDVSRDKENKSPLVSYSLDVTKVALSSDFTPRDEDIEGL